MDIVSGRLNQHIILDIDETLLLTIEHKKIAVLQDAVRNHPETLVQWFRPDILDDFSASSPEHYMSVHASSRSYFRPGLRDFLRGLKARVQTVSIWSAGDREYVQAVAKRLEELSGITFDAIWDRSKCTPMEIVGNQLMIIPREQRREAKNIAVLGKMVSLFVKAHAKDPRFEGIAVTNTMLVDDYDINKTINGDGTYIITPYALQRYDIEFDNILKTLANNIADFSPFLDTVKIGGQAPESLSAYMEYLVNSD